MSPDHANSVEPILAQRIEVIRGPATLLYGNGAIGGIVNVIDEHILESVPEATKMLFQQSCDSVNSMDKSVFSLNAGSVSFTFYLDGVKRKSDDVRVPGFALGSNELIQSLAPTRETQHKVDTSNACESSKSTLSMSASFISLSRCQALEVGGGD